MLSAMDGTVPKAVGTLATVRTVDDFGKYIVFRVDLRSSHCVIPVLLMIPKSHKREMLTSFCSKRRESYMPGTFEGQGGGTVRVDTPNCGTVNTKRRHR